MGWDWIVAGMMWVFEVFEVSEVPGDFDHAIFVEARTFTGAMRKAKAATPKGWKVSPPRHGSGLMVR
jgi:hypothetical protein